MATKNSGRPELEKQDLPLSKSTFPGLVEDNCIYVDKTRYIYPLVRKGGAYLLAHPRPLLKILNRFLDFCENTREENHD